MYANYNIKLSTIAYYSSHVKSERKLHNEGSVSLKFYDKVL